MMTAVPPAAHAALRRLFGEARERARSRGHDVLLSVAVPLAQAPDLRAYFSGPDTDFPRVYWSRPSRGTSSVGLGATVCARSSGPGRFEELREHHRRLTGSAVISAPSYPGVGPVFFSGFRFDAAAPRADEWAAFGDGLLLLPMVTFTQSDRGSWLTLNVLVRRDSDLADTEARLLSELAFNASGERLGAGIWHAPEPRDKAAWRRAVDEALGRIETHAIQKVVLARRLQISTETQLDARTVLATLEASHPECLVFAFAMNGSCFLGATPELLVRLDGDQVASTCLAGTAGRSKDAGEDAALGRQLLESAKDLREHAFVVEALQQGLGELCSPVEWNERPVLLKLSTVQHLATYLKGTSRGKHHVLDFVQRLHPTPAVAGVPRAEAVRLIRELEGMDRGWYTGPIGIIDRYGEGEFGVALRCALLRGGVATLYAGAGIVAGSEADREYAETALKFRPLLAAMGALDKGEPVGVRKP